MRVTLRAFGHPVERGSDQHDVARSRRRLRQLGHDDRPVTDLVAFECLPCRVAGGVVATETIEEHRTGAAAKKSTEPCRSSAKTREASGSRPRHAASIGCMHATGGFPVASAIRWSSSMSCATVRQLAGQKERPRQEFERKLQVHQRTGVAGEVNLSIGQDIPGFVVPQLEGEHDSRSSAREPEACQRLRALGDAERTRKGSSARVIVGAAVAYPSVKRTANASSRRSTARAGSGPGGAARAASAASRTPAEPFRSPTQSAAASAFRWASRANSALSGP